jgi:hypothetical protein
MNTSFCEGPPWLFLKHFICQEHEIMEYIYIYVEHETKYL